MKRLFCSVVTSFDGTLESPLIFHIQAETMDRAEKCTREQLVETKLSEEMIDEHFEMFTFEVSEADIIEA